MMNASTLSLNVWEIPANYIHILIQTASRYTVECNGRRLFHQMVLPFDLFHNKKDNKQPQDLKLLLLFPQTSVDDARNVLAEMSIKYEMKLKTTSKMYTKYDTPNFTALGRLDEMKLKAKRESETQ